jgi:hypothetical protein
VTPRRRISTDCACAQAIARDKSRGNSADRLNIFALVRLTLVENTLIPDVQTFRVQCSVTPPSDLRANALDLTI